jgi:hypothetical protein
MLASRSRWGRVEMDSGDRRVVMLAIIMEGEEGEEMKVEVEERNDVEPIGPGEEGELPCAFGRQS